MAYQTIPIVNMDLGSAAGLQYDPATNRVYIVINTVRIWSFDGSGNARCYPGGELKENSTP